MLVPSDDLLRALNAVQMGYFLEPCNFGSKIVLAAKLPTEQIRHLYHGAPIYFAVSYVGTPVGLALWSALSIRDDSEEPFFIQRVHPPDAAAQIMQLFGGDRIELHVFDELGRCVASFWGDEEGSAKALSELSATSAERIASDVDPLVQQVLMAQLEEISKHPAMLSQIELRLPNKKTISHFDFGINVSPQTDPERAHREFTVEDQRVGPLLENDISRILCRLFPPDSVFPSPVVGKGSQARELIDVVVVTDSELLLFEAKAVDVGPVPSSMARRHKSGRKSLQKAVRQLGGVSRHIRRQETLYLQNSYAERNVEVSGRRIRLLAIVGEFGSRSSTEDPIRNVSTGESDEPVCVLRLDELSIIIRRAAYPQHFLTMLDELAERKL
jgi:hypothetical protein